MEHSVPTTGGTDGTASGGPSVRDRIETLTDAIATANRAAIRHQQELAALRFTLVFALILGGVYLLQTRQRGTSL